VSQPRFEQTNPFDTIYVLIHLKSLTKFMSIIERGWTARKAHVASFAFEEVSLLFKPQMDTIKERKER
jgi:hypothetical protein